MMTKRCLALALCLVMALALLVPVQAAVPMGDEQAEAPVTPAAPAGAPAPSHSHAVADTPSTLMEVHEHNFADGLPSSGFFTTTGGLKSGVSAVTATVSGQSATYTGALKLNSSGSCSFTTTEAGTLTLVLGHSNNAADVAFKLNDEDKTATNHVYTENLQPGTYTVKQKSGETYLYYISFGDSCDHAGTSYDNITKPANCYQPGEASGTCPKCKKIVTKVLEPTGQHTWSTTEFVTIEEPTCTEAGKKVAKCTTEGCTATNDSNPETIPALEHRYEPGYTICVNCGVDSVTGEKHTEHEGVWTDVPDKKATCTTKGEQTRTCTKCGKKETQATDVIAHNFTGEGGKCIMCGKTQAELDAAKKFLAAAGDLESAYALWAPAAGVSSYTASVIDCSTQTETKLDDKLIREYPGYMRVDALGLKAGTYQIKVKANTGDTMTTDVLEVLPHERTGFAFVDGHVPGAYNKDGTLKSGAKVVYVTTDAELAALLNDSSIWNGKTEQTPTCVRIIGQVSAKDVLGFQEWTVGLTVEGVGKDATLTGGGVFVKGSTDVEVRNLGVFHVHSGGKNDLIAIEQDNDHIWVHNNDLYYGFSGGGDQAKGDGSLDVKDTDYSTFSYNHFWDSGKCSLLGNNSSEDYITYHHNWFDHSDSRHPRTRGGENGGNIHVYNNFYDGVSKYGVGTTSGKSGKTTCSVFIDSNYFRNTKYPILNSAQASDFNVEKGGGSNTFGDDGPGFNKAYNNEIVKGNGFKGFVTQLDNPNSFDAYVVANRSDKVPSSVSAGGSTYNNFDTTIDLGVTAEQIQDPTEAMKTVMQWAGRVQGGDIPYDFDDATEDTNYAVIKELDDLLTNHKSQLISIGGQVTQPVSGGDTPAHTTHTPGPWEVTKEAGCDPATQQVVNGQRVQKCIFGGEVLNTETLPGYHTDNGTGTCSVCGATISSTGGGSTGGGKTLQYSDFSGTDNTSIQDHIADVAGGYFSLVSPDKVLRRATSSNSDEITCIQLDKEGKGGIQFTVSADAAPAKLSVNCSATSDSHPEQTSALVVKKDGAAIADDLDRASVPLSGGAKAAVTVTYSNLAAGTYVISAAAGSAYTLRIYKVTVTEAASSGSTTPSDNNFLDGAASDLHYTVSASTGTVTMTDAIPADDLVFATYWKGDHFLGAKTLTQNQAATALSGWDSIKLIWLNKQDVPQCQAKTVATH